MLHDYRIITGPIAYIREPSIVAYRGQEPAYNYVVHSGLVVGALIFVLGIDLVREALLGHVTA